MNEDSLYRQTLPPRGARAGLWLASALVLAIAAVSIYFSHAVGQEKETKNPAPTKTENTKPNDNKTMPDSELRKKLTPEQYQVTRENATEPPFHNAYWDNHKEGIYVDLISGEPLFSSTDKFESGTGWPSFTKPIDKANVVEKTDRSLFMSRTEVRSKKDDAHLGHLFDDGPQPTGMRYCLNSASLRFVPKEKMEEEGYGKYLYLFGTAKDEPQEKK